MVWKCSTMVDFPIPQIAPSPLSVSPREGVIREWWENAASGSQLQESPSEQSSGEDWRVLLFALIGWLTYMKSCRGVVCMWRSKDDFWEPVLSSHNVNCSKSQILLIEFGSNCLCPLSHIACLGLSFSKCSGISVLVSQRSRSDLREALTKLTAIPDNI